MDRLQRPDDRYPSLFSHWLTGVFVDVASAGWWSSEYSCCSLTGLLQIWYFRNWFAAGLAGCSVVLLTNILKTDQRSKARLLTMSRTARLTFSMVVLIKAIHLWEHCCDWLNPDISCAESTAVIGWNLRRLLAGRRGIWYGRSAGPVGGNFPIPSPVG